MTQLKSYFKLYILSFKYEIQITVDMMAIMREIHRYLSILCLVFLARCYKRVKIVYKYKNSDVIFS